MRAARGDIVVSQLAARKFVGKKSHRPESDGPNGLSTSSIRFRFRHLVSLSVARWTARDPHVKVKFCSPHDLWIRGRQLSAAGRQVEKGTRIGVYKTPRRFILIDLRQSS